MKVYYLGLLMAAMVAISACNGDAISSGDQQEPRGLHLAYMDTTVSPSQDFYQYVNGNWMHTVEMPADRGRWGSFDELRIQTSENTLKVLDASMKEGDPDLNTDKGKAAVFYRVAMDTAALDELGLFPIQEYLHAIQRISTLEDLNGYLSDYLKINGNPYFGFSVRSGLNESDTNSLFMGPGALGLPERDYYVKTDTVTLNIQKKYTELLTAAIVKMEIGGEKARELAEAVFELEKKMAKPQLTKEERRNTQLLNNPMAVEKVNQLMSFVDVDQFLRDQNITGLDTIIVTQPEYARALNEIIENTPLESHKAYLAWTALNAYGNYLDSETEKLLFSFYGKTLEGTDTMKPRWERVLNTANNAIGEAIGQLYVAEYFPPAAKDEALELIDNVKAAFAERIDKLEWMTEPTKEKALEKLSTFTVKIGYPDEWKDYSALELQPINKGGSYAGNIRNVRAWNWKQDVQKIGKAVDKSEWFMAPQVVNAYYNPSYNEIVFPAAILQPPFFDFQADPAVNYGGIGAVIGHEISHGFDDQGSRFDAYGNLKNWWTPEDKEAFDARTGQLVEQYNQYKPFDDLAVNGRFTLGENIGDLGGVNVAYDALLMHLEREKVGTIDGFTQPQRFFINWATIWRTKYRDEALRKQMKTDPHSPGMYRAIGPIANMDAFYAAFDIQEGDELYVPKEHRIKIW